MNLSNRIALIVTVLALCVAIDFVPNFLPKMGYPKECQRDSECSMGTFCSIDRCMGGQVPSLGPIVL
jgi:hypothetical protein